MTENKETASKFWYDELTHRNHRSPRGPKNDTGKVNQVWLPPQDSETDTENEIDTDSNKSLNSHVIGKNISTTSKQCNFTMMGAPSKR